MSALQAGRQIPGLYVVGISHLNVVVEDMEYATEFYGRTLGFVQAHNERGVMDYPGLTRETFARDAGFFGWSGQCRHSLFDSSHCEACILN